MKLNILLIIFLFTNFSTHYASSSSLAGVGALVDMLANPSMTLPMHGEHGKMKHDAEIDIHAYKFIKSVSSLHFSPLHPLKLFTLQ